MMNKILYPIIVLTMIFWGCTTDRTIDTDMDLSNPTDSSEHVAMNDEPMVDIMTLDDAFELDIRYATDNNFMGKAVYTPEEARCLLRESVAHALVAVHADLKADGYRLKIYDCFRPALVQQRLWEVVSNPDYVAQPIFDEDGVPIQGSKHNRGAAVDLTLITIDGDYVDMPTDYDDFSEQAHPDNPDMPEAQRLNVKKLSDAMQRHGFTPLSTEWWHFDGPNWETYGLK